MSLRSRNIILAAPGRFHAGHLASALAEEGALRRLYWINRSIAPPKSVPYSAYRPYLFPAYWKVADRFWPSGYSEGQKGEMFEQWLLKQLAKESPGVLHGWNGVMFNVFSGLKGGGWTRCLERSCPHNQVQYDLLCEEGERLGIPHVESPSALKRAIDELYLADVISVPSSYSASSYTDPALKAKVRVNALGANFPYRDRVRSGRPGLRVLMVGNDFLRKGCHYLIEAFRLLDTPGAELWIRGRVPDSYMRKIRDPRVKVIGDLLPGSLNALYRRADVFVQPSIDEGFGMTVLEALAHGLPVVITENVGAKDILTPAVSITVPIRDPEALARAILQARQLPGNHFDVERKAILDRNSWRACAERMLRRTYSGNPLL